MRVAILSDVHGDGRALATVLADIERCAVEEHWLLGDLVAHGPSPDLAIKLLRGLPGLRAVRGNTDRYVLTGDLSPFIPVDAHGTRVEASRALGWTYGVVSASDGVEWLAGLPVELRLTLPGGERVLLVHAAPGTDDGPGLYNEMTDDEMQAAGVAGAQAELVLVGHTHVPMDRTVGGVHVVNPGSVGNPVTAPRRSTWALLTADDQGYTIEPRSCPFDMDGLVTDLDRSRFPAADWLKSRLRR